MINKYRKIIFIRFVKQGLLSIGHLFKLLINILM